MKKNGYTLLELSVSLTILAVLLSIGLGVMGKQNLNDKSMTTTKNISYIEKAIEDFYRINGYIPCPASGGALENSTSFGVSASYNTLTNECDGGVLSSAAGMVPVRSLMILDEYAYDGWGRKFTYRVSKGLGASATFSSTSYNGDIKIIGLNGQEITNTNVAFPNNYGASYVIISHGQNGDNAAWKRNNITAPTGASGIEAENTNHSANKTYIQNSRTKNFDDIVAFKLKPYFIQKIGAKSPIIIPKNTCINSYLISNNPVSSTAAISSSLATQINTSASLVTQLCENPPDICSLRPTDLSNIALWYDGKDINGNGSSFSTGASVATWVDKSGGGRNATQGTAPNRPVYQTNLKYPSAGLNFNTNTMSLAFNLQQVLQNTDYTIFMVGNIGNYEGALINQSSGCATNTGMNWKYGSGIGAAGLINMLMLSNSSNDVAMYVDPQDIIGIPGIFVASLNSSGTNHTNYGYNLHFINKNGTVLWSRRSQNVSTNPMSCLNSISTSPGQNGFLGEIIIYNRALNDVEISKITEYLSNRWFSGICS